MYYQPNAHSSIHIHLSSVCYCYSSLHTLYCTCSYRIILVQRRSGGRCVIGIVFRLFCTYVNTKPGVYYVRWTLPQWEYFVCTGVVMVWVRASVGAVQSCLQRYKELHITVAGKVCMVEEFLPCLYTSNHTAGTVLALRWWRFSVTFWIV